jgi:pyrroloquinoline quinone (PQQ) biosynthesis protein C
MSRLRFTLVDRDGVAPHAAALGGLERSIRYPIADGADHFTIDHGPRYHPFFSTLGEAFFLLALDGDRVAAAVAGVGREVRIGGRAFRSFYACDLKVAPEHRGRRVVERMVLHGLSRLPWDPRLRGWKLVYGAAMRGERGDLMRSARGAHPLRLFAPLALLRLYFVPPAALAGLDPAGAPLPPAGPGAELSAPPEGLGLVSTAGRKDLRLASTGAPWPLVHLTQGPGAWRPSWGSYLAAAGAEVVARGLPRAVLLRRRRSPRGPRRLALAARDRSRRGLHGVRVHPPPGAPRAALGPPRHLGDLIPMSPPSLRATVAALKDRLRPLDGPYLRALADGSLSREDFVETQIQFLFAVVFFSRPMAALAGRLPRPEMRLSLLDNVRDEHGEGNLSLSHERTFLALLARLGVALPEIERRALWPEVRAFNTVLAGACLLDDTLTGLAALGIVEDLFSGISAALGRGIVARGFLQAGELVHYQAHEVLDVSHAEGFYAVLDRP